MVLSVSGFFVLDKLIIMEYTLIKLMFIFNTIKAISKYINFNKKLQHGMFIIVKRLRFVLYQVRQT